LGGGKAADSMAQRLEQHGMTWAVFWEDSPPSHETETMAQLQSWSAMPHYHQREGKPVVMVCSRVYDRHPLNDKAYWATLGNQYHLVFDKVPRSAIAQIPSNASYTYWDVPFTSESDLRNKYALARDNGGINRYFFVNHGFDNRSISSPGVVLPNVGGYSVGSWPEWLKHQYKLAMEYDADVIVFPWNEFGEHSAFEPTDPAHGTPPGLGTSYYDEMKKLVKDFESK
jgi:hypothetical protein